MISPPFLKNGDKVGIVAPARKIGKEELAASLEIIRSNGLDVVYSDNIFAQENQFAGSDQMRASELQQMIDDKSIKAIMFARGGYGSVRIIDRIDFSNFISNPCWLVGYSDATVFHSRVIQNFNIQTLHASMPINFLENTIFSLESLFNVLRGKLPQYEFKQHHLNRNGNIEGILTGGNLSVLYSLLGSSSFPKTEGRILFLEDVDEYLYHIDRMMMGLKRAGVLSKLSGLLIGGMTDMNDNTILFGKTAEEIIRETVDEYDYPVYFGFPAGHIADNRAIVMGGKVSIKVNNMNGIVTYYNL